MFEIVLASFQEKNKLKKGWFFQKIFLLANTGMKVIFENLFSTFSNVNIQFTKKKPI